jgi:solute carrier family 8 (sodium/calcium exchanger)
LLVTWKLLFAIIPPIKWGGGKYAFGVALTLIGVITGVVGEVAELFGCILGLDP